MIQLLFVYISTLSPNLHCFAIGTRPLISLALIIYKLFSGLIFLCSFLKYLQIIKSTKEQTQIFKRSKADFENSHRLQLPWATERNHASKSRDFQGSICSPGKVRISFYPTYMTFPSSLFPQQLYQFCSGLQYVVRNLFF